MEGIETFTNRVILDDSRLQLIYLADGVPSKERQRIASRGVRLAAVATAARGASPVWTRATGKKSGTLAQNPAALQYFRLAK